MKKILTIVLTLAICLSLFAGCANQENVNNAETADKAGKAISPLLETLDVENLTDCTVAVSLEKGDAYVDGSGKMMMKVNAYSYELYDMVDISALEEKDVIIRQGEEIEVTEIERLETGLVRINGGEENGGFDLISDNGTVYFEIGMSDAKAYYELGEAVLPVSEEFVYTDSSDLEAEAKEYYAGDFLTDEAGIEYNFVPHNTSIVVENGVIIKMNKVYIP